MSLNLSDNYYLRKCFLSKDQVPTQSQMLKRMREPLAKVYFGSMTPKLKVIGGFQPPMKGGGNDWYMPPDDLLKGRAVLKPIKREYIGRLGYKGIEYYSDKITREYRLSMAKERADRLEENDQEWKHRITHICYRLWHELSQQAAERNTKLIVEAFHQYTSLYATSLNKIEHLLLQAAYKEIEDNREMTYQKMMAHYEELLKDQANMLYSRYARKLEKLKTERRDKFVAEVKDLRLDLTRQIHKINEDKHSIVEKFRALMECQNLACQLYVAMKEQEEHKKEINIMEERHKKKVKEYKKDIAQKDFEIKLEAKKDEERQELIQVWRKKICKVVKSFQDFIGYCLNTMPEEAEFFLDMEKLLLLQLDEAIENPEVPSMIVPEEGYKSPVPRPHPFYLVCDKGYKPKLEDHLCPKHCTSSASQFPVVVINKRNIYAACDNFTLFTEKLEEFIKGKRGDDSDVEDDHSYTNDIPIQHSPSQDIMELQLQSSIMQIIQKEIPNLKNAPIYCCDCHLPHCYLPSEVKQRICIRAQDDDPDDMPHSYADNRDPVPKVERVKRSVELKHEREPKLKSYLNFIRPQVCKCFKTAKKHLQEHLPPYMINMSAFESPELPEYEACSIETLRELVKEARGIRVEPPKPQILAIEHDVKHVSTQCEDEDFNFLCSCFSEAALEKFFTDLAIERAAKNDRSAFKLLDTDANMSTSFLQKSASLFAMEQAIKLRKLVKCPEIEEIFMRPDCRYDKK